MLGSLVAFGLLLVSPADTISSPRHLVTLAFRATEQGQGDSLLREWELRVSRDSSDRAALLGLATLARLRYDYGRAERLYHVIRRDSTNPDALALYAQLGLAQGFDAQGLSAKATTELIRARAAARALGDSAVEGEALLGLSLQRAFTEGIETGLATLDTVARLVPAKAYELHVERLRQRAALRGIVGRPGARTDADSALTIAHKTGLNRLAGQALRSTAQVLQFEGKLDSSIAVLRQAEELYRRGRDRTQLSSALLWHVNALLGQGELSKANELAHLALREGEAAHNRFSVAAAYTGLGSISIFLSDFAAASDYLDRSIEMFEQVGDSSGAMKARDYLAVTALAAGDPEQARRLTLEVLQWYRRTQEAQIELSAHRNLAIIAMHQGNWAEAERALRDAHALARRLQRPLWSAELAYDDARLALFRGNLPAAERGLTRYLATLDTTQHVMRHDVRVRLADVYARRGELGQATREAEEAWDELERWRATLSERELRVLAFQTSPTEMSDRDAVVVRVLARLAEGGETEEVFELAERRRARELAERLLQATTLQGQAELRDTSLRSSARVTGDEVARLMPDSTALLEYVTGSLGAPTTLLVASRESGEGRVRGYPLPAADSLKASIARFAASIQNGSPSDDLARTLGDALLGPALTHLGPSVRRLIIVPDGPLHRVAFDALRLPDGRYVAEQYAVSLAPSAGVLAALWKRPRRGSERDMRLLAFGDPRFAAGKGTKSGGYQRLPRSGREARLVASYSPGAVVRVREDASEAFLKHASLDRFRVLHFATHTLVDEQTAARTALLLSPGGGESGLVGPGELAALHLDADLVVLSSCRSAGGVIVQGEGVQGLTAPLLQAGARSVVATQWEVGDRGTVRLIESLYRNLASGAPVGDALHRAKLEVLRRRALPREWAAFVTVGDPAIHVPLRAPPRFGGRPVALIGSVLAGSLVAAYLLIRRRRSRA
jgi:CHAT domain-containing protein/tetratricopeptide (TPR) repeat protein